MKKFIVFAAAIMFAALAFAKPGDCTKCTKKNCTAECKAHCNNPAKCAAGLCK